MHQQLTEQFNEWWVEERPDGSIELTVANGNAQGDGDSCRIVLTPREASALARRLDVADRDNNPDSFPWDESFAPTYAAVSDDDYPPEPQ